MEPAYLGIDLHKVFFQVCAVNARGERQWEQRRPTTDLGIAALLTRCDGRSQVAVEASSPTWAFVDRIVNQVGVIHVVDTRKTRIKAGDAAKTDRLDAQRLADALRRDSVVGIYYPPAAIRDVRELARYRCRWARLQARLKQRIHALLLRQGVPAPRALFTQRGTAWLETCALAGWAGHELRGLRQVLTDVRAQLVPVVTAIRGIAATDPIATALIEAAIHQFRRKDNFGRRARQLAVRKGASRLSFGGVRRAPRSGARTVETDDGRDRQKSNAVTSAVCFGRSGRPALQAGASNACPR